MTSVNTQCRLAARPTGLPKAPDWAIVDEPIPWAANGEFVVEIDYLSIDPAMRTWMNAGRSYVPAGDWRGAARVRGRTRHRITPS